jgi:GNAT superfamily N-acetyltransferase
VKFAARENKVMSAEWTLSLFRTDDAPGVVDLHRAIYGNDHYLKAVYDTEQLVALQENGDVYRAVALDGSGKVVGHTAYARSCPPNKGLYEACGLLVNPEWRGTSLATELTLFAIEQIPLRYNITEIWGEAVCNHNFSQRIYTQSGHAETGMEFDLLAGDSVSRAMQSTFCGRISVVTIFKSPVMRPQTIYLPSVYEKQIPFLYSGFQHGHSFSAANGSLPTDIATAGKLDLFAPVAVARITFFELGADFDARLEEYDSQAINGGAKVFQVFLPLTSPSVGAAVAALRHRGYFLGAVLPRWFGDDGLLMQKLIDAPDFSQTRIFTDRAKEIQALLLADMQTV